MILEKKMQFLIYIQLIIIIIIHSSIEKIVISTKKEYKKIK